MIGRRWAAAALVAAGGLAGATPGWAKGGRPRPGRAEAAEVARARAFVKAGSALFDAGDFAGALASYQKAEPQGATLGDPAGIRWNIARCLEELGRAQEAVQAFDRYLELPDAPEGHADARRRIEQLERRALGIIVVTCSEDGARVQPTPIGATAAAALDERTCPERWGRLTPGAYRVVGISRDGRASAAEVAVEAGREVVVRLAFAPSPAPGSLADPREDPTDTAPGLASMQTEAEAQASGGGSSALAWVALGTGVASAVVGAALVDQAAARFESAEVAFARYRAATDADALVAARADTEEGLADGRTFRTAGYVLLGVGAVSVGLATWLFLDGEPAPLSLNLGPEGAALGWVGRW